MITVLMLKYYRMHDMDLLFKLLCSARNELDLVTGLRGNNVIMRSRKVDPKSRPPISSLIRVNVIPPYY